MRDSLLFNTYWLPAIKRGVKTTTIRRSADCYIGQHLDLREDRSPSDSPRFGTCLVTGIATILVGENCVSLDGVVVGEAATAGLAMMDGFDSADELVDYINRRYGLPFFGEMIAWTDFHPTTD